VCAVGAAGSHAACEGALAGLAGLAASEQGCLALAGKGWRGWQHATEHLLSASPATAEDASLWLRLLPLVGGWVVPEQRSGGGSCRLVAPLVQRWLPVVRVCSGAALKPWPKNTLQSDCNQYDKHLIVRMVGNVPL
jgi:hypothetical protein